MKDGEPVLLESLRGHADQDPLWSGTGEVHLLSPGLIVQLVKIRQSVTRGPP